MEEISNNYTFIYIAIAAILYVGIIYYRISGITKRLLILVLNKIENKALSSTPETAKIFKQLKQEIYLETKAEGIDNDMQNALSVIDEKHKKNKFLRVIGTIGKIILFLK